MRVSDPGYIEENGTRTVYPRHPEQEKWSKPGPRGLIT